MIALWPHGPLRLDPCPEGTWASCHDPAHLATVTLCRTNEAVLAFLRVHRSQPPPTAMPKGARS